MMNDLSAENIQEALRHVDSGMFGAHIHYYPQVGSTNDILRVMAEQGAPAGTLVVADEQTSGRGRMGRTWTAPPRTSLLMSVLFRPLLHPAQAHRLVMVVGLAAARACEAAVRLRVDVKWPNDLQIERKKLAGILPESAIEGDTLTWVIVGIGINVNTQFEKEHPLSEHATSLAMATGHVVHRATLLALILQQMHQWYGQPYESTLSTEWQQRCVTLGQRIAVSTPQGRLIGTAEALDEHGALWLRADDGSRHYLTIGEATIASQGSISA